MLALERTGELSCGHKGLIHKNRNRGIPFHRRVVNFHGHTRSVKKSVVGMNTPIAQDKKKATVDRETGQQNCGGAGKEPLEKKLRKEFSWRLEFPANERLFGK